MSSFRLNSFPGVNDFSKTASGIGNFSPNFLNSNTPEKSQQTTGFVSKGREAVLNKLFKLILPAISLYFSILRRFVPSFVWNFLIFFIPPLLAFYELALRGYFPRLPSVFAIAFKLYQRGILTVDIIMWLASSLPASFVGGLGSLGGAAMRTTAAMMGGATSAGNAVVGTTTSIVGNTSKTVAQGINHLTPGVSVLAEGTTQAVAGGLSLVKNSQAAVKENISGLVNGEHAITVGNLVPNIAKNAIPTVVDNTSAITGTAIGVTKAAVTENATKLANVLDSVNPLRVIPKGSQDSQAISPSEPAVPSNANGAIQAVVGKAHAVADAVTPPVVNPLAVIGASKAAATENVTKVANALGSVNPLHLNVLSKGSESSSNSMLRPKLPGLT